MAEIRLRVAAEADLAAILDYSAEVFGEAIAVEYLASFEQAFVLLAGHPQAGALRAEIDPPIRCLPHRRHRIFYDVEEETIWIVRVLHHAMDAQERLAE